MRKVVDDKRLIYKCCKLYYEEDLSQQEIADRLAVSRVSVNRMLQAGKEQGMVIIRVVSPNLLEYSKLEAYAGNRAWCQRDRAALIQHCGMDEEHIRFFSGSMEVTDDLTAHLSGRKVNKFFTSLQDPAEIPALRRALDALPGVRTLSAGEHYVEVVPEGADKQRAVRMVWEALGLSKDQIMVIGDSENDLGMFDQAHTCVAMGNACPTLKAKANYIAPSNCEDGVAWAVETLLLGESAPRLTGHIETIGGEEIARSLEHSTRQYLTGDLKLPQQLRFLYDPEVEAGISAYPYYRWEHPHYHTLTAEYCYILEGETKYIAHKLDNIIYFIDNNGYQLDGPTDDILRHGNLARKAEGFGLHTQEVDGHDVDAIYRAIVLAKSAKGVPSCIVLKTTKGKGATFAESSHEHSSQPKEEQWQEAIATAEKALEEIKNA